MIADDIQNLRRRADEHEELLDLIAATLKTHAERIAGLGTGSGTAGGGSFSPAAADWRFLDADAARQAWDRLLDWADWLAATFPVADVLPACWARHPALLWDVTALHLAHAAAYEAADAPPGGSLAWIEQLERAMHRWRLWDQAQCASSGRHRDDHTPMRWPEGWRAEAEGLGPVGAGPVGGGPAGGTSAGSEGAG